MEETKKTHSSHLVIDAREGFFHAMLSYRVSSDADLVTKIHDKLHLLAPNAGKSVSQVNQLLDSSPFPQGFKPDDSTLNSSLRVFLDAYCLKDGVGWEGDGNAKSGGFVGAVRLSPVFVPLFSATEIVTANTELAQQGSSKGFTGSVGQMIGLAHTDMQDNVLLELIVARELHLMSKTSSKTNDKKVLFPCSYILPLFRNADVWKAASSLPKTASALTNTKAKHAMEQMGVRYEDISPELRDGTLTVQAVWQFFTKFQGIKLYDRGEERFQVAAAANAIIGVIDEVRSIVAESKFHDLDMSSSQMYELSGFMSQLNMSNYTPILASHHVSNVFQLAELRHSRADAIVQSIAEYGVRASDKSTLPIELSKVGFAIQAAQSSPLAKPLNDRFRNFVDRDASFVTILSSSSLIEIVLSKKLALLIISVVSLSSLIFSISRIVFNPYRGSLSTTRFIGRFEEILPWILFLLASLVSALHSPRSGRYILALALFCMSILSVMQFVLSAQSALYDNCLDCRIPVPPDVYRTLTSVQAVLSQPTSWCIYFALAICVLFKQKFFFPVIFAGNFINAIVINSIIGWSAVFKIFNPIPGPAVWISLFAVMCIFRYMGNKRAQLIYQLNSAETEKAFTAFHEKEKEKTSSPFVKPCASPSSKPQRSQPSCFGIFSRKQQNPERAQASGIPMRELPFVVCVPESDQHLTSNSCDNHREAESPLVSQAPAANPASQLNAPGKFQNIISIEDMFMSERTLQGQVLQRQRSFEKLIQDAEFTNDAFQEWVGSWLSSGPDFGAVEKYFYVAPQPSSKQQAPAQADGDVETNAERGGVSPSASAPATQEQSDRDPSNRHESKKSISSIDQCFRNLSRDSTNPTSRDDSIKGKRIRGPLKHVDRAIAKVCALFCNFSTAPSVAPVFDIFVNFAAPRSISAADNNACRFVKGSHTAAPQAHRAYSGNFRRLTDIVRCCLVVDTPEDLLKLVQVRC
jgi:hypothetical protein